MSNEILCKYDYAIHAYIVYVINNSETFVDFYETNEQELYRFYMEKNGYNDFQMQSILIVLNRYLQIEDLVRKDWVVKKEIG